jgi:actin-related protein 8
VYCSVLSTIIAQQAQIDRVEVLPAPRELDPEVLVWKGASVMGKLDSAKDMWIGLEEWENIGSRCLRERALLM